MIRRTVVKMPLFYITWATGAYNLENVGLRLVIKRLLHPALLWSLFVSLIKALLLPVCSIPSSCSWYRQYLDLTCNSFVFHPGYAIFATRSILDLLMKTRTSVEIIPENLYVYAVPKNVHYISCSASIRKYSFECGAEYPDKITPTILGKQYCTSF